MLKLKNNRAFTLMEVVIAVSIISLGLVGILSIVQRSLSLQPIIKNKIIAINLAQEGIEIVRNIRDSNWLSGNNWRLGLGEDLEVGLGKLVGCINYDSTAILAPCSDYSLGVDDEGDFYTHNGEQETPLKRTMTISYEYDADDAVYMSVKSEVIWEEKGRSHSETVEEFLYDWN